MWIHDVCRACSMTKKAVAYYIDQGLVSPEIQENGYRRFSEEDVSRLNKIGVLRGLGLSAADIRRVLSGQEEAVLRELQHRQSLDMAARQERHALLGELAQTGDWEQARVRLGQLEARQSILERLMTVFPGQYGRFIALHFSPYLQEPIETHDQQEALEAIIAFLDGVHFQMPADLQAYLDEISLQLDEAFVERLSAGTRQAMEEPEAYIAGNRDVLEAYLAYKQSEAYRASPACRLEQALRQFTASSGYTDVFLPAMRRLSRTYREYSAGLQRADEVFLSAFPSYRPDGQADQ